MKFFKSKIDLWLAAVLLISVIVCLAVCVSVVMQGDKAALLVAVIVALPGIALPLWILTSTNYVIDGETLIVKSGPFSWRISVSTITALTATRNPLSSPALSLDRLRIDYANGQSLMVSPKDKQAFSRVIGKEISS